MHLKKNDYNKHTNFYLKSTINQNNKIFKFSSNKQCTAICAYAIGFSSVVPIKDWNVKILDRVIREGNNYYNHCQFLLRQNNIIYTSFLAVDEILEEIELNNKVLRLSQYLDYEYDNTTFEIDNSIKNLNSELKIEKDRFYKKYKSGCIKKLRYEILSNYHALLPQKKRVALLELPDNDNYDDTIIW